jgi:nucleoid-associated protein YgaU
MTPFKHAYMLLATDFELEPVIEQYLATYPDVQPRKYEVIYKLKNERHQGDYCYIIVYEYVTGRQTISLVDFIKAYCELNDKVANIEKSGNVFPDLAKATYGNPAKYNQR